MKVRTQASQNKLLVEGILSKCVVKLNLQNHEVRFSKNNLILDSIVLSQYTSVKRLAQHKSEIKVK